MNYKFSWVDQESGKVIKQWVLALPVTIGRSPTADITLDTDSISRRHCQFLLDPHEALMVKDTGSKNGVFVDDRRVDKTHVQPGSVIRLGLISMRVELTDEQADAQSATPVANTYEMDETKQVKIVRPKDDRYEIG